MHNRDELQEYQNYLIKNGMAHLVYDAPDIDSIVHPFSIAGSEILSDELDHFLQKYRNLIPPKAPIVLEIVGGKMTDDEKELADETIWNHFCLLMTKTELKIKHSINKCLFFLLMTILSTVLICRVDSTTGEIMTNFAYILFYFFGYRLLLYTIIDGIPLLKSRKWYRRLAAMKLIFNSKNNTVSRLPNLNSAIAEEAEYSRLADKTVQNWLLETYRADKEIVTLSCKAESIDDLIELPRLNGRECLSPQMAGLLEQIDPYFSPKNPIVLTLQGKIFDEEEQKRIRSAFSNYYLYRIALERSDSRDNQRKILSFAVFVILSVVLLLIWGNAFNVGWHDFLIMVLWFFGDYLLEFLLINPYRFEKTQAILKNCRTMRIEFQNEK